MSSIDQSSGGKIKVGLLFGGRSGEHEVSLTSARGILAAIDKNKYEVVGIGITKEGAWVVGDDPLAVLEGRKPWESVQPVDTFLSVKSASVPTAARETGAFVLQDLDVVFPILHGPFGEDGTVQGFLDLLGMPYVGAGVTASALAMDKTLCKHVLASCGLKVLPYLAFRSSQWHEDAESVLAACERDLHYPLFVKPANMGSSVGINKVRDRDSLRLAIGEAFRFDRKIVVEQGIEAREIEISVLGNDEPAASVPGEIVPSREFYSYAAKYIDDASELLIPAPLTAVQAAEVKELALLAYKALDCAGMARVDFLVDKVTGEVWLNELNTIPGFTPISMYPKLWEASDIGYSALIDRLLELALERHQERSQLVTSFDVSQAT
jgi:D-alanine-D-alanine ligase